MTVISIVVTIEERMLARIREVSTDLTRHGLTVETEMPELGLIFGRCDAMRLPELARIRGVTEARAEDRVNLPPMEDDTPQ